MSLTVSESIVEKNTSLLTLSTQDWARLGTLFDRVFGHPLAPELASYKYANGKGESMALSNSDDEIIAHCGMTFRQFLAFGVAIDGVQLGDLMVAPSVRGSMSRTGQPFFRVVAGALRRLETAATKPFVFGFPSNRAMRIGERLGLFSEIDQITEIIWPISNAPLQAIAQPGSDRQFSAVIDRLWKQMAADLKGAVVGVRDSSYFVERYFHHPLHHYHVYLVRSRWFKLPLGAFVLRGHGATVELMDWIAPLGQGWAVIEQARRAARELGGERLMGWMARAYAPQFANGATSCTPTEFRIPACGLCPAPWLDRFKDHMWLTSGDTDYR